MKLKKILIFLTIFTMFFHFSIQQALASEVRIDSEGSEGVRVDESDNDNTENDEAQNRNLDEAENKNPEELPYTEEDSHDKIIIIKEKLNALSFDELEETEVFDESMAEQVEEFQHYYELEVTGEVDELTLEKLNEVYHSELQQGNEHTEIVMIKEMLSALGYDDLEEGQVFGELTKASVKAFQNDHDLLAHGIVDDQTMTLLEESFETLEISLEDPSETEEATSKETTESTEVEEAPAEITTEEEKKDSSLQRSVSPMSTEPPFENGDTHPDIAEMKVMLNALGFDGLTTNGVFGNWTETRVAEFQEYYELSSPRGIADQETLNKVNEVYNSPYQKGNSNEQSSEIKIMLSALGYSGLNSGPVFGNLTETRLKEFQRDQGLMDHGIGDEKTISKLEELYNADEFRNGDNHPEIAEMKRNLNGLGFDGLTTNGVFGNWTETRVSEFQEYYDLPSTGIADRATLDKVSEVYNSPYQNGNSNEQSSEIKIMLSALGYSGLNSGPVFGNLTEARLKEFQRDQGLMEHGIGDEKTISKLEELYNADEFRNGDNHPYIAEMKVMLNALGFNGLTTNGVFGNWTETRVSHFQEYYGLSSTGVADRTTLDEISSVYNSPYQNGNSNSFNAEVKNMLHILGYRGLTDNNVFGNMTERRLKEFQNDYGLVVNGIADEPTVQELEKQLSDVPQNGHSLPLVSELKKSLNKLGYNGLNTGPVFGNLTEQRLKEFQSDYGLRIHGYADQQTVNKLNEIVSTSYTKGDSSSTIREMKNILNVLGYGGLSDNNVFGSWTETRVKQFQRDNNIAANGVLDERTMTAIRNARVIIYLDPGHGGSDTGGQGLGLDEKDVVLDIALAAVRELRKYHNVEVVLSRSNDTYRSLEYRSEEANRLGADYFVSLHMNALNGSASGFESFIFNGSVSNETRNRQRDIHNYLANWLRINSGIRDRGMKTANFHVLRETTMPAILLEYMFIDNSRENNLLRSSSYRNQLGKVTAEAIADSFNLRK